MRYLGSKINLLTNIEEMLNKHLDGNEQTFLDLFSGTNVVGNYFKDKYHIFSNDLLYFCYVNAKAQIENNSPLTFKNLADIGINNPIEYLQNNANKLNPKTHYYEEAYTPTGGAMYFSVDNGKRIDYIRETIDEWKFKNIINDDEYYYLLSALLESLSYVSNTTGTYGAFLKKWDKRALNQLNLKPFEIKNNLKTNKAFNENANELIKNISADIVYIDTPYNSRQYASNYHVLENIARNNHPNLKGKTRLFDWSPLKSEYAQEKFAYQAMDNLLKNIQATHVIISYNDEGIIPLDKLIEISKTYSIDDRVDIEYIDYRKYKSKKASSKPKLQEVLIYIRKKEALKSKNSKSAPIKKSTIWQLKNGYIKSPLNYIGGKYKLLNQILPLFPKEINTFVDIFSGGANVGINVNANHHIFNDMNYRINEMFRYFSKHDSDFVIQRIKERIKEFDLSKTNEDGYKTFRTLYNSNPNPLDLYVLVSYSYNYQFRFNNDMKFNNPFGRNRSCFSDNMERNLYKFIEKLKTIDASFTDYLFEDFNTKILTSEDFVYLDPPYLITTGNYNDGNRGFLDWNNTREIELFNFMDNLNHRGIRFALSNVTEHKGKTNQLLKNWVSTRNLNINYLNYNYNNSSHNSKSKGSQEVLITNYDTDTFQLLTEKR